MILCLNFYTKHNLPEYFEISNIPPFTMIKDISEFYDAAKALSHCEIAMDQLVSEGLSDWAYEYYFNSFIFYINQSWELAQAACDRTDGTDAEAEALIDRVRRDRYGDDHVGDDELVNYVRQARNQLTHRRAVLWLSSEEDRPEGIGTPIEVGPSSHKTDANRYSTMVTPSFALRFTPTKIAVRDVTSKGGDLVKVPTHHQGSEIENTPTNIAQLSYEYYGSTIERLQSLLEDI